MEKSDRKFIHILFKQYYGDQPDTNFDWNKKRRPDVHFITVEGKGVCAGCGYRRKLWPRTAAGRCKKCRKAKLSSV